MYAFIVLCIFPLLFGTISSIVNIDEHVIVLGPTRPVGNVLDHDDHSHEDPLASTEAGNDTSAGHLDNSTEPINSTQEFEDDHDDFTHEHEVDDNGCQLRIRDELERRCFVKFEDAVSESLHIEVAAESEKAVCCALEEYEKCCYSGYRDADCQTDKDSLKETLKAARIFLGAITKNSCSGHRGKCDFSSSAGLPMSSLLMATVLVTVVALV